MREYVSWASPIQSAEKSLKAAGDLLEDRKVNAAVIALMETQVSIAETIAHLLTRKK